jgi:hypothetical protein
MRRGSKGISSIYGFIMIFLLCMASIQTWSSAVGSLSELQSASAQSHQLEQMQGLESLSLSLNDGDLTVTNVGQTPSALEYLRLVGPNDSRTLPLGEAVAVGGSIRIPASGSGDSVEVVTSLGNVFVLTPRGSDAAGLGYWSGQSGVAAGDANVQLYRNPSDPSVFFLGSGSTVHAFSKDGDPLWSFDAGQGVVTDVMPVAGGDVYVSVGYVYYSNSAQLYELSADGSLIASFPVRLEQIVDGDLSLQAPVSKSVDPNYALYDGWFYSAGGPVASLPSDGFPLAASDDSSFYFFQAFGEGISGGDCVGAGDEVMLYSYTPNPVFDFPNWTATFYLAACGAYPPQLLAASAGNGLFAGLFSGNAYGQADLTRYTGQNPYLFIVTSSGSIVYGSSLPDNDYSSSMATDGTNVYLALPQSDQVQAVSWLDQRTTTYTVGFPASQLMWENGSLFAISGNEVRVYGSGMSLEKTISFAPLSLASFSNGLPSERSLHDPSFIPLNTTSFAALLENSTGYTTMVIGRYA